MRLNLQNISKQFPGIKALDNVEFTLAAGEVHALCGENGAGKSTLMNIISGNIQPDTGVISVNNETVVFADPQAALKSGVAIVYQHLSLADNMSAAENIFANQQPCGRSGIIDFKTLYDNTDRLLKQLYVNIHPKIPVSRLSPAQKQMIEIAKALSRNPQILILDEPTASLTEKETAVLFDIIKELKEKQVSVIYISHRLPEIFKIADRITILKDGKNQGAFAKDDISHDQLIKMMVGREIKKVRKQSFATGEVLLKVENFSGAGFKGINFNLHCGEILGFAGLAGAGRTEVARAIFGADKKTGSIFIRQKKAYIRHTADAIKEGMAYVPEERKQLGLFMDMTVTENIACSAYRAGAGTVLFNYRNAAQSAKKYADMMRIATPGLKQKVLNLSGGNQQKVVLAKWLLNGPEILIVDEPTHGIDVGAKFEIYEILVSLAKQGKGIVVISSDMPELLGLCDRILVLRRGELSGELSSEVASEEKIMALAT